VLVVGTRPHDLPVPRQDVHLPDRLVREAVAEGRRLDAESSDGASEGDRLELRYDQRRPMVRQESVDDLLVGGHPLDLGRARVGIDVEHPVERADVEPGGALGPEAEQVGGGLGQPDRSVGGQPPVLLDQFPHLIDMALSGP
jgi:hypothetical protein